MKIKHTPGPWQVFKPANAIETEGGFLVAYIPDLERPEVNQETKLANANLIAAAPEMYLHLAECVASLRYYAARKSARGEAIASMMDRDLIDRIEALLDKATGQNP